MRVAALALFMSLGLGGVQSALAEPKFIFESIEIIAPFGPAVMTMVAQAGVDAEVRYVPYARMAQDLAAGTVDGAFFVSETFLKATTAYEAVPVPLYKNEYLAVTLTGPLEPLNKASIRGKKVAYPRGYTGMVEALEGADVTTVTDEKQGFRLLGAGRIEFLVVSRTSAQIFGAEAGRPIQVHEPPLVTSLLYLVLRRGLDQEREALTSVFRQAVKDGSWDRAVAEVVRRQAP